MGTIKAYDGTAAFLGGLNLTAEELEASIVGTIGDMDQYMLPDAKGATAMSRCEHVGWDAARGVVVWFGVVWCLAPFARKLARKSEVSPLHRSLSQT